MQSFETFEQVHNKLNTKPLTMFIRADCKNVLLSIGRSFYYKWNYTYGMDRGETRKGLWVFRKTKAVCTPRWVRWIGSFYQVIKFWMKNIIWRRKKLLHHIWEWQLVYVFCISMLRYKWSERVMYFSVQSNIFMSNCYK